MEHVVFDGVDLSERFIVLFPERRMPSMDLDTEHVAGSDGYIFKGRDVLPQPVTFRLVMPDARGRERRELARWLGGVLYKREPCRLSLSGDDGLWCMAMLSKAPDLEELVVGGTIDVTMQPAHAAMYGEEHSIDIPSGGSATLLVGGTYPTMPTISAQEATPSSLSGVWGLTVDNGDVLHVPMETAAAVEVDCEGRTCTVGGLVTLPTLDSDWFTLEPGTHVIRNDQGSGACTVTWNDRWL